MNRIKELRKENNLSIDALSRKLKKEGINISASSLSKYEREVRNPKIEKWQGLAKFFGVTVSYLQGISNIRNIKNSFSLDDMKSFDKTLMKYYQTNDIENIPVKEFQSWNNEKDLYQFEAIKKIFLNSDDEFDNKYRKLADEISDMSNISEIDWILEITFYICLRSFTGNEKSKATRQKIVKLIEEDGGIKHMTFDNFKASPVVRAVPIHDEINGAVKDDKKTASTDNRLRKASAVGSMPAYMRNNHFLFANGGAKSALHLNMIGASKGAVSHGNIGLNRLLKHDSKAKAINPSTKQSSNSAVIRSNHKNK